MRLFFVLFALTPLVPAQAPSVQAEWDVSQAVAILATQSARITPLLDQLTPTEWVSRGASETFVAQWRAARAELGYLASTAQTLQRQPEKLTAALETYFRLQTIEIQLKSLADGVRTYQNPAVADLLLAAVGENSGNRDRLQAYITDLAGQKEQELAVIDREAPALPSIAKPYAPSPSARRRPSEETDGKAMNDPVTYACSICGEPAQEICVFCTKDACDNHRCEKCQRCSDCCQCELRSRR